MARYYRLPFGVNGDREDLTDETANSLVSYSTGYTQDYQRNPATDDMARRPERTLFNDLMFEITDTLKLLYETGVPPFITSAMNNGNAFSYPIRARVLLDGRIYESNSANNTNTPPHASWTLIDLSGLDARFARLSQNLADIPNKATARTNLELGSAATRNVGTAANDLPSTSQADGRFAQRSNNLSDLASATTARTNLGLGTAATVDTGTGASQIPLNSQLPVSSTSQAGIVQLSTSTTSNSETLAATASAVMAVAAVDRITQMGNDYRVFSSGLKMVWGTASGSNVTVTLPISFDSTNSMFLQVSNIRSHDDTNYAASFGNVTAVNTITIRGYNWILTNNTKRTQEGPHHYFVIGF